jgi:hypothetical protein
MTLRICTEAEFEAVRSLRGGIYSTCTDIHGQFGTPRIMTCWSAKGTDEPLCKMETVDFPPGGNWTTGRHTYFVNPDYLKTTDSD